MKEILGKKFFERPALAVAPELLGKYLVRRIKNKEIALMITEVEAYEGQKDKASHAHRGLTKRNAPMWGEAGRFYVYLTYGMHWMLNIVTGRPGYPAAVLIRGIARPQEFSRSSGRVVSEVSASQKQTKLAQPDTRKFLRFSLSGPGKLTKYLKIGKNFNDKIASKKTGLWFEDRGVKIKKNQIKRTPRIGVDFAGPIWSKKHYRFLLKS